MEDSICRSIRSFFDSCYQDRCTALTSKTCKHANYIFEFFCAFVLCLYKPTLFLRFQATFDDEGTYACVASNYNGTALSSATVSVNRRETRRIFEEIDIVDSMQRIPVRRPRAEITITPTVKKPVKPIVKVCTRYIRNYYWQNSAIKFSVRV